MRSGARGRIAAAAASAPATAADLRAVLVVTLLFCVLHLDAFAYAHTQKQCHFPAIFNFGDSNSDTGGLSSAFGPAPPPNGESFFHKPAGRYCDGRLVIDFIAESMGLPYLSAYLQSVGSNFSHGANFATAGSCIRQQNTTLFQSGFSPFSLDVQQWQFDQFRAKSVDAYNAGLPYTNILPRPEFFSQALYTFDIGQNDLTSGLFLNMTVQEVKNYVPTVVDQFATIVKNIYNAGGRTFLIHNTGPVGCLPYVLDRLPHSPTQIDRHGCAIPYNQLAQYFNQVLKQKVMKLRKDLPFAKITHVDMYAIKYGLIADATQEGFKKPLVSCCGYGGQYNYNQKVGCGGKGIINGTIVEGKSCIDPWAYLIWDGVHYTQAANKIFSQHVISAAFSDPPLPLSKICF